MTNADNRHRSKSFLWKNYQYVFEIIKKLEISINSTVYTNNKLHSRLQSLTEINNLFYMNAMQISQLTANH